MQHPSRVVYLIVLQASTPNLGTTLLLTSPLSDLRYLEYRARLHHIRAIYITIKAKPGRRQSALS